MMNNRGDTMTIKKNDTVKIIGDSNDRIWVVVRLKTKEYSYGYSETMVDLTNKDGYWTSVNKDKLKKV